MMLWSAQPMLISTSLASRRLLHLESKFKEKEVRLNVLVVFNSFHEI